jgi:hypothetical protein
MKIGSLCNKQEVQAAVNGCISKEENPDPIGEDSLAVHGTQAQKNKLNIEILLCTWIFVPVMLFFFFFCFQIAW